ncbi:MAG: hypothetical protein WC828_05010 [Thermoleophilia bacterium]|jgi:hypothetical protein
MKGITQLQVHNLEGRIGTELLKSDLTSIEVQRFLERKKDLVSTLTEDIRGLVINRVRGLYVDPDKDSFTLYERSINHDRSVDELVEEAKKAGWWVRDNYICNAGQVDFNRKPERRSIHTIDLTISRLLPKPGKGPLVWKTDINKLADERLLTFNLAELLEFIPYREELLAYGVSQINALGSRFCGLIGIEDRSVACLKIKEKELELQPLKNPGWPGRRRWMTCDWFGLCN